MRHAAFTDASGIRVTDSRYNGPANTGRTRSAARTVPKGREGRRDKKKESSYAEPGCGHDGARDSNRKANKKRKKVPHASRDRFLAVACTIRGVPVRNEEEKEARAFRASGQRRRVVRPSQREDGPSFGNARMNAEKIGNTKWIS